MANIKSAKKRIRQNEKRRVKNSQVRSSIRTTVKSVIREVELKGERDTQKLGELYKKFVVLIDKAEQKGIVHKSTAARKKSRLAKKVNSVLSNTDG